MHFWVSQHRVTYLSRALPVSSTALSNNFFTSILVSEENKFEISYNVVFYSVLYYLPFRPCLGAVKIIQDFTCLW